MYVAWFHVGDRNAGVMTLPVVKVASRSEEDGNHWRCEKMQTVPVGLVPYHGDDCLPSDRHTWQQVLVRDVSAFKPDLEPGCDPMSS